MKKIVWLDEQMHKWIKFTADKGPEFSVEAQRQMEKLIGDDGIAVITGQVEEIELYEDDKEVFGLKVVHPYCKGSVKGFRFEACGMTDRESEVMYGKNHGINKGDLVMISGVDVSCEFMQWFNSSDYELLKASPEWIGYYYFSMDMLDIQRISSIEELKNYTVNDDGWIVSSKNSVLSKKDTSSSNSRHGFLKPLIVVVGLSLILNTCGKKEEKNPKEVETEINSEKFQQEEKYLEENLVGNPYEIYKDYPQFSEQYTLYYINSGELDLPDFSMELESLEKVRSTQEIRQMYVLLNLFEEGYRKSSDKSNLLYEGGVKDEKPNGVGTVTDKIFLGGLTTYSTKRYQGFFDKGKCDDFGISYTQLTRNVDFIDLQRIMDDDSEEACQKGIDLYLNPIEYIGYYENGEKKGRGIYFEYPDSDGEMYSHPSKSYTMKDVVIYAGDFRENAATGKGKIYLHGMLWYEGEMKKGKKNGTGELYYQNTDKVAFRGSFKNDEVAEGTLYSPDGDIICEGKWENNLCGITDFYDVYYQYSKLGERDVRDVFGKEYDDSQFLQWIVHEHEKEVSEDNYGEETDSVPITQDYILPNSNSEFLTYEDIADLNKEELRIARNEIYARHGRLFQTEDLNEYFSSKSWYYGYLSMEAFDDSVLNNFEKANLDLIKSAEAGKSASEEWEDLESGLYQDTSEVLELSISVYSNPIQEGTIISVGDMEMIWEGKSEWSTIFYDGTSKMKVADMYGNDIGTLEITGNDTIIVELYGNVWKLSRKERYFGN